MMYLQKDNSFRWSVAKWYRRTEMRSCYSLTVTAVGEVVLWGRSHSDSHEAQWYDQQGKLIHTLPNPPQREYRNFDSSDNYLHLLALDEGGKQQVALSSRWDQCIWLGSLGRSKNATFWRIKALN